MATAESPAPERGGLARRSAWPLLAVVLGGGLGLRLWGVQQGLPFAYNADENDHFVPHAVQMFEHGTLNPHYFANPPAFTYVLHFLFGLYYGSGHAVVHAYFTHPTGLYTLARVASALLGAGAVWLLYLAGARLFGRAAGLLAAAIEAVAFLPVFYAHLALNDVPTLAPLTLSLLGSAGVLRKGRLRDHLLAGIGLGLACATKYTAGIVIVPYAVAAVCSYLDRRSLARAAAGVVVLGACALAAFLVANPYSLLDYSSFHRELVHQSTLSAEAQGKLGAPKQGGLVYYLWALTWGLGWAPALAALAGAVTIWRRERRLGLLLVPAPLLFLAFMGTQGRYFGRWLMPILPILCLLAAGFAASAWVWLTRARRDGPQDAGRRWGAAPGVALAALMALVLIAQGLVYSVHSGLVLSRDDTRTLTRNWMLANVPAGAKVVVEPVSPNQWALEPPGVPTTERCRPYKDYQWCKWPSEFSYLNAAGELDVAGKHKLGIEDYERTLSPALIGYYESSGFCWVVTGSAESGRAYADPKAVPEAIAYYRALAAQGQVVYRASPYSGGHGPVSFNFDWSFDYYPLAYRRPGPSMTVYRLSGGRCRA
jgi:Dolichyl-phosphate-mannose-protein mannosyltransferase